MNYNSKNTDWRNAPITEKQFRMLRCADEYFSFERLDGMTRGEASDYISEYYVDGVLIDKCRNKRDWVPIDKENTTQKVVKNEELNKPVSKKVSNSKMVKSKSKDSVDIKNIIGETVMTVLEKCGIV